MPTFEAQGAAAGHPAQLLFACALAGLAVGLFVFGAGRALAVARAGAVLGDDRRHMRRRRAGESPLFALALSLVPAMLPLMRRLPLRSLERSLAERYAEAGWPLGLDDDELMALALLVGLALCIPATLVLLLILPPLAPLGLALTALGPGMVSAILSSQGSRRRLRITRTMPYVLDVLVLTMRAGGSFLMALQRVAEDYAGHPVGAEFRVTLSDIELGMTSREAFEKLAERVPLPLVRSFVDEVNLAEELGRPLADALESLADRVRTRRVQEAVDTAGRAKVMVLVPGMLILLASLIILFSPFIVRAVYGGYTGIGR
jgi:tight adherence protein C